MEQRNILGIDFGTVHTGIAISENGSKAALPLSEISTHNEQEVIDKIDAIIKQYDIHLLVMGLPTSLDNTENEMTKTVQNFSKKLHEATQIRIVFEDERLTSQSSRTHQQAAALILQSYLDKHA